MQDTILIPVSALADSIRAVLDSVSVRFVDSVRVALQGDGVFAPANVIASVAVVVALVFSWRAHKLQARQDRIERALRAQQTDATDRRIAWLAFRLAGRLHGWMDERSPVMTLHKLADGIREGQRDLWHFWNNWLDGRTTPSVFGPVEKCIEGIMDSAPVASTDVARIATEACRHFYQALAELRKGVIHVRDRSAEELVTVLRGERALPEARRLFLSGYDALRTCVAGLEKLLTPELRASTVFLRGTAQLGPLVATGAGRFIPPPSAEDSGDDPNPDNPAGATPA
jgi:hypothetical protein